MNVARGDVVIVDYPYPSGRGRKRRPAVVVQNDINNHRLLNTIVVAITTNITRVREPTQLLIDINTPEGRQSGFLTTSTVSGENILTIEKTLVHRKIGSLPQSVMDQINECLKASLEIP